MLSHGKPRSDGLEEQAARCERRVLDHPEDGDAWASLGMTYYRMGHDELALEVLERAARLGPVISYAWYDLSFLLSGAGRTEEALAAARRAAALAPESARVLVNLGTRLLECQKPHEAIPYLQKAVRVQPEWPEPIGVLGIAHYHAQHFGEAAECLETALRRDPEVDPSAWAYLGVSLDETGRPEGAVHALETAVSMKPDYGWAWARLGKALRTLGRHAEAVAAYEKAIGHSFAPSVVWWDMGLSAAEVPDLALLERACHGLRKLDAAAARKLRRKLRSLRAGEEGEGRRDPADCREEASATRRGLVAPRGELVPERAS